MIMEQILRAAPAGTVIPKPAARSPFRVKGTGTRRGQRALIYTIPNRADPSHPHEKGVTAGEFELAYQQLMRAGEFTRAWFNSYLRDCATEGSCNFTTIGGLLEHVGIAKYADRGVYRKV